MSSRSLWLYALLGILCALCAAVFVRGLYWVEDRFDGVALHPIVKAAVGFGMVGIVGTFYPQVLGVGYDYMQQVFYGHVAAPHALALAIFKMLATWLTLGSCGSGGIFSPSLFTGAMIGDAFGRLVHDAFPTWTGPAAAYGLVAMAALFGAAAEAPITSIVIVLEMSNDYRIILPLMICTVMATLIGRRLIGGTVYELKLIRRGIDWSRARRPGDLRLVRISDVVRTFPTIAKGDDPIADDARRLEGSDELAAPVAENGSITGVVTDRRHLAPRSANASDRRNARAGCRAVSGTVDAAVAGRRRGRHDRRRHHAARRSQRLPQRGRSRSFAVARHHRCGSTGSP